MFLLLWDGCCSFLKDEVINDAADNDDSCGEDITDGVVGGKGDDNDANVVEAVVVVIINDASLSLLSFLSISDLSKSLS